MSPTPSKVRLPTALVADDDAIARRLCRAALEAEGYVVHEATDTKALFSLARDHCPDLVITDASLSATDGSCVVPDLRSTSQSDEAALIVLSELESLSHVMTTLGDSVDDYLAKPLRPEELAARVTAMARRTRGQREARRCRERLGENSRILESLLDFSLVIAESEQIDRLAQQTAMATASMLSCRRAAIMLPCGDSATLRIVGSVGIDSQTVADLTVPIGEGIAGRVYASGSKMMVDSASDPDGQEDVHDSVLFREHPALVWAMRGFEKSVGVIYSSAQTGPAYGGRDDDHAVACDHRGRNDPFSAAPLL